LSFIDLDVVRAFRRKGSANPVDRKPFDKRSFSETKSSPAVMASQAKPIGMLYGLPRIVWSRSSAHSIRSLRSMKFSDWCRGITFRVWNC